MILPGEQLAVPSSRHLAYDVLYLALPVLDGLSNLGVVN